jgi:nucleoside-diphosphate-sugar epimerase
MGNEAGRVAAGRILIVGCGDVGLRVARLLSARVRIFGIARDPARAALLRRAGIVPIVADLDDAGSLTRVTGLARLVIHLAPPESDGEGDQRTRRLVAALGPVERVVYVSTSGVYGDCAGALIDETRRTNPQTARARRRVAAELVLRQWARRNNVRLTILRTPGIYAAERLPLARLREGTPVLAAHEDVYTNHIHADDLARLIVAALYRGAPLRAYHASDSSELLMGEYFSMIADAFGLARPARLPRAELVARIAPTLLSFMSESRRLCNRRALSELGVRLHYPQVRDGLAAIERESTPRSSERP